MSSLSKIAIIGTGNILMSDDGAGVIAVRQIAQFIAQIPLRTELEPESAELKTPGLEGGIFLKNQVIKNLVPLEAGTDGSLVLDALMEYGFSVIIDTLSLGKSPGTLYQIPFDRVSLWNEGKGFSLHETSPVDALKQAFFAGAKPRGFFMGIEPKKISPGIGLSLSVQNAIPRLIKQVFYTLNLNTTTSPSFIT